MLTGVKATGRRTWVARCPAHEDHSPSLSIRLKNDGRMLFKCFTGCNFNKIASALNLKTSDLREVE